MFDYPPSYVAIDVETTGLDPVLDRVTEVAAVRYRWDGVELANFHTLVNPGREIPLFVEALTGIRSTDVATAPTFGGVAVELTRFVGDDPVVGHNVAFDLACLEREGLSFGSVPYDTAALARALLPGAGSHTLGGVAAELGIDAGTSHRALADARTAGAVFASLVARASALPAGTRLQLARLLAMESVSLAEVIAGAAWDDVGAGASFPQPGPWKAPTPLSRIEDAEPAPPEMTARAFAAAPLAFPGFEERPQQAEMAAAVARAFQGGGQWLVEAGTGVGKSLAYLVPAAIHALATGERVVISTNTIALQEQLLSKDVPSLRSILHEAGLLGSPEDLRVALLKGRGNYLCYRRWLGAFTSGADDPDFARLGSRVLLWIPETETGDRAELNLDPRTRMAWARFSAQDADCLSHPNAHVREGRCFLARARREAEAAHLVIVNHALLLADIAGGGSALPSFEHLVVDEAHNLEDVATRQFSRRASRGLLAESLSALSRGDGRNERAGGIAAVLRALPPGGARAAGEAMARAVIAVEAPAAAFFGQLGSLLPAGDGDLLITRGARNSDGWTDVELSWSELDGALGRVLDAAAAAVEAVQPPEQDESDGGDDLLAGEIEGAAGRLREFRVSLERMVSAPDDERITWVARERDEGMGALNSAPLDVGPLLAEELFEKRKTVVATSATLAAAGSMTFAAERMGLPEADTLQVGSPFDYERVALLAEVTDVPDPGTPAYGPAVAEAVARLVEASRGRALVLFTSHASLRDAAARVRARLDGSGITILAQDEDGSPRELINILRSRPQTAVFGTASFWEGVDVRGEALSLLVIARLPFAVPTDPIHQARSALYDDPFGRYSLPAAILRFRQGFGRLIRDRDDRGAVVILDRRTVGRSYGPEFLRALPACARFRGPSAAVAERVRAWLS